MRNFTDSLIEAYALKKRPIKSVKENLSNPRSLDEIEAARATVMAKQAKLNIELAKLDAEAAAYTAQQATANLDTKTTVDEPKIDEPVVEEEPVKEPLADEPESEETEESSAETAVVVADPIEEPVV